VLALAGYSFGSRIAAQVGGRDGRIAGLALIAPPLAMDDFGFLEDTRVPTLVVAGTRDQYCPPDEFARFTAGRPWITAAPIEGADHFFFGKLYPLGEAVTEWTRRLSRGGGVA
jgi:alpha/beta superfamily hydrolase